MIQNLKVALDARKLGDGGIGSYIEALVDNVLAIPSREMGLNLQFVLICWPRHSRGPVVAEALERWKDRVEIVEDPARKYSISEYFLLPLRQKTLLSSCDIYHAPHYTLPFGIPCPAVVTIHDVIHLTYPDSVFHRPLSRLLVGSALRRAREVITVSEATFKNLEQEFSAVFLGQKCSVVRNALTGFEVSASRGSRDSRRYLFVGSDRQHKRLSLLLDIWPQFAAELSGTRPPKLTVVGTLSKRTQRRIAEDNVLSHSIVLHPALSKSELESLYREADCVLIPSMEEGFGYVALEAVTAGCEVICSPVSCLAEVFNSYCHFAADFSSEAFLSVLMQFARGELPSPNDACREQILSSCSGSQMAFATVDVYKRALSDSNIRLTQPKNAAEVITPLNSRLGASAESSGATSALRKEAVK